MQLLLRGRQYSEKYSIHAYRFRPRYFRVATFPAIQETSLPQVTDAADEDIPEQDKDEAFAKTKKPKNHIDYYPYYLKCC